MSAGVHWQPFSDLALAELPQVHSADDWKLPEPEISSRRDLRGSEYFICSIDPPGLAPPMWPIICLLIVARTIS